MKPKLECNMCTFYYQFNDYTPILEYNDLKNIVIYSSLSDISFKRGRSFVIHFTSIPLPGFSHYLLKKN